MGGSTKLKTRQRLIDMRGSGPTRVCPNAKSATRQSRKQTNAHDDANATWADGVRQHYSQNNMYKKTLKNIAQESPNHPKRPPTRKPKNVPIAISPTTFLGGTQHHNLFLIYPFTKIGNGGKTKNKNNRSKESRSY